MNGMSYQVLARKWRPRIFREMVGQEHVLQALINALDHNRLHHAYLFTGTRGVGKTTIARILAKCLNCETGVSSEPCGQCSACREIAEGRFVDLIEVDAASRTKVEDTRELLENVQYSPTRGRYKVYLIDEVHMLSNSSFNALLKTLEEPPPHVKFLLATTDPQKLPMTILSRCLQFNLKNMNPERIVGHLKFVLDQEVIPFEEAALWQLGRAADGSMRDALSLTDQAISYGSGKITDADVATMLGTLDQAAVYEIVSALTSLNGKAVLNAVQKMSEQAPDYANALAEMLSMLHRIAIAQALPEAVDNSHGDKEQILQLAQTVASEDLQLFYQIALLGRRDLPLAPDSRAGFEMVLLRMLAFKPQGVIDIPTQTLPQSIAPQSTTKIVTQPVVAMPSEPMPSVPVHVVEQSVRSDSVESPTEENSSKKIEAVAVETAKKILYDDAQPKDWPVIYLGLGVSGILQSTIANCEWVARKGNEFHFVVDEKNNTLYDASHQDRLADLLSRYFSQAVTVRIQQGNLTAQTPAMIAAHNKQQRQERAVSVIKTDPIVLQIIEKFGATLREDTIQPV
jgi:DNA polymerase III subunit gamma/tau